MKFDALPRLGLAHFTVLELPPPALVDLAAATGYRSVGLRLHPAFPGSPFYEIPSGSAQMREMRQRLDATGIRIHDIEFVVIDAEFVPRDLAPMLEAAADLGARRLSVCGEDPDPARLVARFAETCDVAAGFGMGVDLECMAWRQVASLAAALRIVEAADRPNGGVLVDALHLSRTGGVPADLRNVPTARLRSAQLCDAAATLPVGTTAIIQEARAGRLPPGDGALPLMALLDELPDDVALSAEVPMGDGLPPEDRACRVFAATRRLFEAHRRAGHQ